MKNFFDNLSKYQKQLTEKAKQIRFSEKISNVKPTDIIDRAKEQYSNLDNRLRAEKLNLSSEYKHNNHKYPNYSQFDYSGYMKNTFKNLNVDKVTEKLKNIDTNKLKGNANTSFESAKEAWGNFMIRSKSAYQAFKSAKQDVKRPLNQRNINMSNYSAQQQNSNSSKSSYSDGYPKNYDVSVERSNTEYKGDNYEPRTNKTINSYVKNLLSSLIPKRERTTYDIYVDNYSNSSSRFSRFYKKNFFIRGYRIFKSNFFWKSLLFFSVLTFVYSYAKHLAMGRSYNQQFEKFIEMQKHMNDGMQQTNKK